MLTKNENYKSIKDKLFVINRSLRTPNGLYFASEGEHYRQYCWWRDTFYQVLPNLTADPTKYKETYHSFLNFLHKYEWKMDRLIHDPQVYDCKTCLHPRIYPDLSEIPADWGNTQMDAICLMLFGIGLGIERNIHIIRSDADRAIIEKCIRMYEALEYWNLAGCDAWEENTEVHSHAIGAVLAAFTKLEALGFAVDEYKLSLCRDALDKLLPAESITKDCDLAQLQLIFPLNIVSDSQRNQILHNVTTKLLRERGVIRYVGDRYYNIACRETLDKFQGLYNPKWEGWPELNELQWTFGLGYLSIIYSMMGDMQEAAKYIDKVIEDAGADLMIPEGYYAYSAIKNPNTPLGWSNALAIVAIGYLLNEFSITNHKSMSYEVL